MSVQKEIKPVLTKAALALLNKNKSTEFKAIVFEPPKQTAKVKPVKEPKPQFDDEDDIFGSGPKIPTKTKKDDLEFDIKKTRQEVLNFAISNQFNSKNKKKMEIFKLVKLGAKPPKKQYKNYKDLIDERKRLKDIREDRKKFHQLGKNQTGAASVKCRSKTKVEKQTKKRPPVRGIDKHYGVAKPKLKKKK